MNIIPLPITSPSFQLSWLLWIPLLPVQITQSSPLLPCGVLCFFTTQAKCIHEGRIKQGGRVSPSYMHVSSTGWLGGFYNPNLYYTMASIPLPAQNILRIFRAVGHFTGWNVQFVYSIRFVLGTLSRRSSTTFGLVPDLREPS